MALVPPERAACSGPGASYEMAAFTHPQPEGFALLSDGAYGVYYAGRASSRWPLASRRPTTSSRYRARTAGDGMRYEDMRGLVSRIDARYHDHRDAGDAWRRPSARPEQLRRSSKALSSAWLRESCRQQWPWSARVCDHRGGRCMAAFHRGGRRSAADAVRDRCDLKHRSTDGSCGCGSVSL